MKIENPTTKQPTTEQMKADKQTNKLPPELYSSPGKYRCIELTQ